jgi:hypothetical protein
MTSPGAAAVPGLPARFAFRPRYAGMLGIGLGIFAFWLALPPVMARSVLWPALAGGVAILLGGFAVSLGARRMGWQAIASGMLGIAGGYLATRSSSAHLSEVVVWSVLRAATVRFATPLLLGVVVCLVSVRMGVV